MQTAFIALGSNIGNRTAFIQKAVTEIARLQQTRIVNTSALYETPPLGFTEQPNFYNAVCQIKTAITPLTLLKKLKAIEVQIGRNPSRKKWKEREIDLDILLYDNLTISSNAITIPHPELHNRKFVLVPLLNLADPVHPIFQKKISELLQHTNDTSYIKQLSHALTFPNS